MAESTTKAKGDGARGKTQVSWRTSRRVLRALRADADKQGFSSIAQFTNHILTLHYFGDKQLKWKGEWVNAVFDKKMICWRMSTRVVNALQADADQWNLSVPALLNQMLTFQYFGEKSLMNRWEQ